MIMITKEQLTALALAFPKTTEEPHFEKTSFRVKKKIFATYDQKNHIAILKLSLQNQDLFSVADQSIVHPVENKWGLQGWTQFHLSKVNPELFRDAMESAYCEVAPVGLVKLVKGDE